MIAIRRRCASYHPLTFGRACKWFGALKTKALSDGETVCIANMPPHVNLLYPFVPDNGEGWAAVAAKAAEAMQDMRPFEVTLSSFGHFNHGRSCTMWLDAETPDMLELQARLRSAFPLGAPPQDGGVPPERFRPHLSLGQWRLHEDLVCAQSRIQASWQHITFPVTDVALISRAGFLDPFVVRWTAPLGSSTPHAAYHTPQELNVPYIATMGGDYNKARPLPNDRCRFGIGGLPHSITKDEARHAAKQSEGDPAKRTPEVVCVTTASSVKVSCSGSTGHLHAAGNGNEGNVDKDKAQPASPGAVWSFAYGANMNIDKLTGVRQVHPFRSVPGRLQGYRLAFNHRGGFGNLIPDPGMSVWGVLHLIKPLDQARLTLMEHEYWPAEVSVDVLEAADGDSSKLAANGSVKAVAFISPPQRQTREGLPPTERYIKLLRRGADYWKLDKAFRQWLHQHPAVADKGRGKEYYMSAEGVQLEAWPKTRTGTDSVSGVGSGQSGGDSGHPRGRSGSHGAERGRGHASGRGSRHSRGGRGRGSQVLHCNGIDSRQCQELEEQSGGTPRDL